MKSFCGLAKIVIPIILYNYLLKGYIHLTYSSFFNYSKVFFKKI